jgi:DNA-binding NarL/FixJ family response regulator
MSSPSNRPSPGTTKPPARRKLRTVIVEDQILFQDLFRMALESTGEVEVVAVAATAQEGRSACLEHRPDLLLLDLALPDGDGLKVASALAKSHPDSQTIIVSAHAETFRCPPALRKHIFSVVEKAQSIGWVMKEITNLQARMGIAAEAPAVPLSPRESEILDLLGQGLSNKQIAGRAFISQHTVETHRKRIAAKLGVHGSELVRHATLRAQSARLGVPAKSGAP